MDERKIEEKKRFAGEKKPSMKRRSEINNYYGRHIYMLTLTVEGRRPLLGKLEGDEKNSEGYPYTSWERGCQMLGSHPEVSS